MKNREWREGGEGRGGLGGGGLLLLCLVTSDIIQAQTRNAVICNTFVTRRNKNALMHAQVRQRSLEEDSRNHGGEGVGGGKRYAEARTH